MRWAGDSWLPHSRGRFYDLFYDWQEKVLPFAFGAIPSGAMPALTLIVARELLWNSASNKPLNASAAEKLAVDAKINQAVERLLTLTRARGSLLKANIQVYDAQVTLPRALENVLGWRLLDEQGLVMGGERQIYNRWFQFSGRSNAESCIFAPGLYDQGDGFVCFRLLPTTGRLKVYTSTTESTNEPFHIRGLTSGLKTYTGTGAARIEGENLTIPAGSGSSVTSTTTFDAGNSLYEIVKPATNGVLTMYLVDPTTAAETLVGRYEPGETIPNYRRYTYPQADADDEDIIEVLCDEAFYNVKADRDQLAISNIGALKNALKALQYEDANDTERKAEYFVDAVKLLDAERAKFDGDSAVGVFNQVGDYGSGSVVNVF